MQALRNKGKMEILAQARQTEDQENNDDSMFPIEWRRATSTAGRFCSDWRRAPVRRQPARTQAAVISRDNSQAHLS